MLCALLKVWQTYSLASGSFPNYGKMYSTKNDEPVAMMMSYRNREVTIVNHKEFMPCFTTEVATKLNVPVINISPNMFKFSSTAKNGGLFDRYVFYDENADIKLPQKVEVSKSEKKITKVIEKFSHTHKKGAKVDQVIRKIAESGIRRSVKSQIRKMVRQIVRDEHKKDMYRHMNKTTVSLRKTLKTEIKHLVKVVLRSHRNKLLTRARLNNILSIVKQDTSKGRRKSRKVIAKVKKIVQAIIKTNAINEISRKKINKILTISRSYPKKVAERKIKHVIHSVIRTRTNKALAKHTIDKMFKFVRSNSGEISDKKIQQKIKRMFVNIVNTTVSTIVPKNKILSVVYLSQRQLSPKIVTKKIKNLIYDIRVDEDSDDDDSDDCPVCKCNFKKQRKGGRKGRKSRKGGRKSRKGGRKVRKNRKGGRKGIRKVKKSIVKKDKEDDDKKVEKKEKVLVPVSRVLPSLPVPLRSLPSPSKSSNPLKKKHNVRQVSKKVLRPSPKKVKRFARKIKFVKQKIASLKKIGTVLKRQFKAIKKELATAETRPEFNKLIVKMKTINRKREAIKKQVAKLNVVKFDASQKKFKFTPVGVQAAKACKGLGAKGTVFKGCMQDMRLTKDPKIVLEAVKQTIKTVNAVKRANKIQARTGNAPSRTCSAVGDPHFTNFNGDYFHIQQPSIYTFAKTSDGLFEVQVKQAGSRRAGEPSYVNDVMIRYDGQVYRGNFNKDGFVVRSGGYVSVTVPGSYQGEMVGICGVNGPSSGAVNFKLPSGANADVNYGKSNWALGGYGGPNSKLSRWHLSWRPSLNECMFSRQECQANLKDQAANRNRYVMTVFGRIDTRAM